MPLPIGAIAPISPADSVRPASANLFDRVGGTRAMTETIQWNFKRLEVATSRIARATQENGDPWQSPEARSYTGSPLDGPIDIATETATLADIQLSLSRDLELRRQTFDGMKAAMRLR